MKTAFRPLILALALMAAAPLAGPLAAQDTTATDPATDPATGLALGAPAATGEIQVGQPYIREEIGDWGLRCLKAETGDEPCQLYQVLLGAEGNPVAEISFFRLPDGSRAAAGATIVAPLETLLTQGISLSVDGAEAKVYPFNFCNRAGCVARVGFLPEEVDTMKAGNEVTVVLVPAGAPDQPFTLTLSLKGFTAGLAAATVVASQ